MPTKITWIGILGLWFAMSTAAEAERQNLIPNFVLEYQAQWRHREPPQRPVPSLKDWFPMGVYVGLQNEGTLEFMLDDLKQHHCNTLYLSGGGAHRGRLLDMAEKADIRVYLQDSGGSPNICFFVHGKKAGPELTTEADRAISMARKVLPKYRDRWGLLCWGLTEEIKPHHVPQVVRYLREASQLDPTHPSIILHNNTQSAKQQYEQLKPAAVVTDIYGFHHNWTGSGPKTDHAAVNYIYRKKLPYYGQLAQTYDAPLWIMMQSFFQWSVWEDTEIRYRGGYPMLSPAQVKVQSWLALTSGAKGLFYFLYHYPDDSQFIGLRTATWRETVNWKVVGELFSKIEPHTPLLLKLQKQEKSIVTPSDKAVFSNSFQLDGRYYLITVNTNLAETIECALNPIKTLKHQEVYNLHTGQPTGGKLRLLPGDGAILLVGDADDLKQHYQQFPQ